MHVEPEYIDNSPLPILPIDNVSSISRRDESVSTIDSVYSADPPAPVYLGKPLPLPPRYRDSVRRDTLFSVIDGYAAERNTTLVDESLDASAVDRTAFQNFSGYNARSPAPFSSYTTDAEITFGSPDREDTFWTWDHQAEHSDDTIMGTTLEGTDPGDGAAFEPSPKLEDIEAIARQSSPGRYGHGIPLEFGESAECDIAQC